MPRKKRTAPAAEKAVEDTSLAHDASSNQPPADASLGMMLDDLELEAANWLDDEPLSSQKQADELTKLVDAAKRLEAEIEATRKAEKEPFLQGGREVDARFKPLQERAEKTLRKLKNKVGEWLKLVAADKARREREAEQERREAERRLQEEHERNRASSNLADDEALAEAERAAEEAKRAAASVRREKVTTEAAGTQVKLRKQWLVNIVERKELLRHYLVLSSQGCSGFADDLQDLLYKHARADVRGGVRSLPGCRIWSEDIPV